MSPKRSESLKTGGIREVRENPWERSRYPQKKKKKKRTPLCASYLMLLVHDTAAPTLGKFSSRNLPAKGEKVFIGGKITRCIYRIWFYQGIVQYCR